MEKFYTVEEVAELTGLTSRTIRTYIADGKLTGRRLGKQWRFSEDDVARLYTEPGRSMDNGAPAAEEAAPVDEFVASYGAFISEKRTAPAAAITVDLGGVSEDEAGDIEKRVRAAAASMTPDSARPAVSRRDSIIVISGNIDNAAKLLKVIRKG